jgi:poly-gamma-glutamate capsule biosynthesis protein CapA/YwtB (metallophosphatase superfamily)
MRRTTFSLALWGTFVVSAAAAAETRSPDQTLDSMPTLTAGGDVNLGRRQNWVTGQNGPAFPLGALSLLAESDLAFANLESVVASAGNVGFDKHERAPHYFRGRPEMLGIIEQAGIDVLGLANNHSMDYGAAALREQLRHLSAMGIRHAGAGENRREACRPTFAQAQDIVVAFYSIDTTWPSFAASDTRVGTCYFSAKEPEKVHDFLKEDIRKQRDRAHLVLVAIHWGPNRVDKPKARNRKLAWRILDAGADGILGSSAHVLHGVEIYDGKPILYDMGNLLFDYSPPRAPSALFTLFLSKSGVRAVKVSPIRPLYGHSLPAEGETAQEILSIFQSRSRDLGTDVRIADGVAHITLPERPPRNVESLVAPQTPAKGPAPEALNAPPARCVVDAVPPEAAMTPRTFGNFRLVGLKITPRLLKRRQNVFVESYWTVTRRPNADLWIYARLRPERGAGRKSWYGHHEPCDWSWPTSRWQPNLIYRDVYTLRPPNPLTDGTYALYIGIVDYLERQWHYMASPLTIEAETGVSDRR